MKGFLKFLLSVALLVIGFFMMLGSFFTGKQPSFWTLFIVGILMMLGGIYMLRQRR